ncbi:type II toxin-antitoxin system RelE/ParE family toxin [Snuella sedimenti]|uniref:Type II toxin-antitoxin system RelE/ParE family toxin n=1 Tax=Snuella sedimenti TaxID=2798802 RepID=A0A8J7J617_9FLAO|nr:type II toxin-antitoxin system RelE/ParE family toxin [Snuella sedimenti]MBJ6369164.1 type II toxin-antitoxin system RelE/ParE family toxin [Snuella sedimenti]
MELEVYWLELAENKLEDIYCYYLIKASKRVAENLVNGIVDSTIGIEKQPEIGQVETSFEHREQEFRYLVFKNYKIVYWINYDFRRIEIANVFDTRQDPDKINETE